MSLFQLLDINVLPHDDANNTEGQEAGSDNDHESLNVTVGVDGGLANGTAHWIIRLDGQATKDGVGHVLAIGRKILVQLLWDNVCPHSSSNSLADSSANGAEQTKQGNADGDFLVVQRSHDGNLSSQGPNTTIKTVEDLTHDEIANVGSRVTEIDEKGGSEDSKGNHAKRCVLVGTEFRDRAAFVSTGLSKSAVNSRVTYSPKRGLTKDAITVKALRV